MYVGCRWRSFQLSADVVVVAVIVAAAYTRMRVCLEALFYDFNLIMFIYA